LRVGCDDDECSRRADAFTLDIHETLAL
jgi:hypothetical protein